MFGELLDFPPAGWEGGWERPAGARGRLEVRLRPDAPGSWLRRGFSRAVGPLWS